MVVFIVFLLRTCGQHRKALTGATHELRTAAAACGLTRSVKRRHNRTESRLPACLSVCLEGATGWLCGCSSSNVRDIEHESFLAKSEARMELPGHGTTTTTPAAARPTVSLRRIRPSVRRSRGSSLTEYVRMLSPPPLLLLSFSSCSRHHHHRGRRRRRRTHLELFFVRVPSSFLPSCVRRRQCPPPPPAAQATQSNSVLFYGQGNHDFS